jgi:putative ABC transport system permease protein
MSGQGGAEGTNGDDGVAEAELSVELPVLGVIRERVNADGFDVWEDSISMQTDVFLPQALAEELFLQVPSNVARGYNAVAVEVDTPGNVKEVEEALRELGFRTVSVGTVLERIGTALAVITAVVSGLSAIALLVSVLGIVNTMIMNVSERTREIGVLKALGATNANVRMLFIVESGLIGTGGGVAGVVASLLASIPGDYMHHQALIEMTQYDHEGSIFSFPPWLIATALGFALVLSVLAALGPATRASRVDPVQALRDE